MTNFFFHIFFPFKSPSVTGSPKIKILIYVGKLASLVYSFFWGHLCSKTITTVNSMQELTRFKARFRPSLPNKSEVPTDPGIEINEEVSPEPDSWPLHP